MRERNKGPQVPTEELLIGKQVFVQVGDGGELTSYYQGHVERVIPAEDGMPPVLLLRERFPAIPLHPNITNITVLDE